VVVGFLNLDLNLNLNLNLGLNLDRDGGADGAEADVGVDDLAVTCVLVYCFSEHRNKDDWGRTGGKGREMKKEQRETYALGIWASTSAGTPESWEQSPRSPPGVPAFSGG